ncbi:MAG: PDZ domain-containing protein [Planctomycetota bacterium]
MRRLLPVLACVLVCGSASAQESPDDLLAKVMASPTSTGLLVTDVDAGSQANTVGLASGDILVSYDGKPIPDPQTLQAAIAAAKEKKTVTAEVEVDRMGEARKFELTVGQRIGIAILPVQKGVAIDPLPPDSAPKLDWSRFDAPGDQWMCFYEGGKKAGFEHVTWTRKDGVLSLRHEVAFDGGEAWGLNHFLVDSEMSTGERAEGLKSRFENPLTKYVSEGSVVKDSKAPSAGWESTHTSPEQKEPEGNLQFAAGDLVPTYDILFLAQALPRSGGAAYRFSPVEEGTGRVMHASALVVAGKQKAKLGDREIEGWQVEWRLIGRPANVYWLDDQGAILAISYGNAFAIPSTKEEALAGLHPDLKPRTAD